MSDPHLSHWLRLTSGNLLDVRSGTFLRRGIDSDDVERDEYFAIAPIRTFVEVKQHHERAKAFVFDPKCSCMMLPGDAGHRLDCPLWKRP
jgi:hypothetical protein